MFRLDAVKETWVDRTRKQGHNIDILLDDAIKRFKFKQFYAFFIS